MRLLRGRPAAVALLIGFTLLVAAESQRCVSSLDEAGYQEPAARHPIAYILTHDPQNHPGYCVLAHLAMRHLPDSPIRAVRVPAVIAGALVPLAFYLTRRREAGHAAALLVATALVVIDPLRYYAAIGRGYSLLVLGVIVLQHLAISAPRRGGWWRAAAYVPAGAATCFVHLWAFPVLAAHGLFLALEWLGARRRGRRVAARRAAAMLAAVVGAGLLGIALYLPMLGEIRDVAGRKQAAPTLLSILDAVLQLPRFASWTVAAHLLLVPIVLEGAARRPLRVWCQRAARLDILTIVVMLAWARAIHSAYFGSRYLLPIVPALAGLAARGLSGYWRGRADGRRLPRPATWAIGLALGVLAADASMAHEIPAGANVDAAGRDSGYYYRDLAKAIGSRRAAALLAAGVVVLALGRRRRGATTAGGTVASAYAWTGVLLASTVAPVLGPAFSGPLFEAHMLAAAAVLLDAWEHRFRDRHLRALRLAFLLVAAIAVAWQAGIAMPEFTPGMALGLLCYVPPILVVLPLALTMPAVAGEGPGG